MSRISRWIARKVIRQLAGWCRGAICNAAILPLDTTTNIVTINFVMTNVVTFSRALADETRWRIIRLVMDEALCVCELADILEMPQSSVSSHVQIIRKAGLLEDEKCEKWTYFRIAKDHLPLLRTMAKALDDSFHSGDADKAVRRLSIRENSCCPGPKKLVTRRKATP